MMTQCIESNFKLKLQWTSDRIIQEVADELDIAGNDRVVPCEDLVLEPAAPDLDLGNKVNDQEIPSSEVNKRGCVDKKSESEEMDFGLNDQVIPDLEMELTMHSAASVLGNKENYQDIPSVEVNERDCEDKKSETEEMDFGLNDQVIPDLEMELTMHSAASVLGNKENYQDIPSVEVNERDCEDKKSETEEMDFGLNDQVIPDLEMELTMHSAASVLGNKENYQDIPSVEVNERDCEDKKSETEASDFKEDDEICGLHKEIIHGKNGRGSLGNYKHFVWLFLFLINLSYVVSSGPCKEDQFLYNGTSHSDSPTGAYMKRSYKSVRCIPCAKANPLEHIVIKSNCTPMSNSVLGCQDGFYDIGLDPHSPMCEPELKSIDQVSDIPKGSHDWSKEPDTKVTENPKGSYGWSPETDTIVRVAVSYCIGILISIITIPLWLLVVCHVVLIYRST